MLRYVDLYYCTYGSIVGIVGWHIMMRTWSLAGVAYLAGAWSMVCSIMVAFDVDSQAYQISNLTRCFAALFLSIYFSACIIVLTPSPQFHPGLNRGVEGGDSAKPYEECWQSNVFKHLNTIHFAATVNRVHGYRIRIQEYIHTSTLHVIFNQVCSQYNILIIFFRCI
jgi:hypothetical protein